MLSYKYCSFVSLLLIGAVFVALLSGCQTNPANTNQGKTTSSTNGLPKVNKTTAAVGGGLLGGIVGNQFGSGTGQTLMTIAGAVGGAIMGTELIGYEDNTQSTSTPVSQSKNTRSQAKPELNKYCHKRIKYHKDVPVDVDVAYVRYKRAFGFMTKNEIIRSRGVDPADAAGWVSQMDNGYRHIVEPGVHYLMKEEVDLDTGYYIGWLSLELEKAGKNKTRVYVNYCVGGITGFEPKYSSVIRKKVNTGYL